MGITIELRMNGTLLASQDVSADDLQAMLRGEFDVNFGVSNDFVLEVEEEFTLHLEEEEEDYEYYRDDFIDEEGNHFHVNMRNHPLGYCEECGAFVGDEPFSEKRGDVFDSRIARDPVFRPLYHFCSQWCEDRFFEHSMRARYGTDKGYYVEFQLTHEGFERFCKVLINGTEVYTVKGYEFSHTVDEIPVLVLNLPLDKYHIKAEPMGPPRRSS